MARAINKNKGMIRMCCYRNRCGCNCRRTITGTFTQNVPVTMAYSITPLSIGNENINFF